MPNRILREGINSSPRVDSLSDGAELLYRRLISVVDDYGRYYASPATIRGACWPIRPERVTERQVGSWLDECTQSGLILPYQSEGRKFLQVIDFKQQVRSKSKFPDPPSECDRNDSNCLANDAQLLSTSRSRITKAETETNNAPESGALSLVDNRPKSKAPRSQRSTDDIRKALGDRLLWWEEFWKVYPCHEGTRAAMDAFERRVKDRDTAERLYRGAKAYALRLEANTEITPKWGQGWINEERWLDEHKIREPTKTKQSTAESMLDRADVLWKEAERRGEI